MRLNLNELVSAAKKALAEQRLLAQAPGRRYPEYISNDGFVSPAGAVGVVGHLILEEMTDIEIDKRDLLKAALLEHAHDVWLVGGKFSNVLERLHHPSRLPPKLFQWLRNRTEESLNLHTFSDLIRQIERYT